MPSGITKGRRYFPLIEPRGCAGIARQRESRQGRKRKVCSATNAAFQHPSTPDWNPGVAAEIVSNPVESEVFWRRVEYTLMPVSVCQ
jgi:hypothetical protein